MIYNKDFSKRGIANTFGRLARIRKKLTSELRLTPDDIVLDVGCDKGDLVAYMRPHCREVFGVDINEETIRDSNVPKLKVADARETDFPDEFFTKIVSSHTVEHVTDLPRLFRELDRILKPGGLVVLYYPWEPIRGIGTIGNAWKFLGNPFLGHKIHVNRLSHRKIGKLIQGTRLKILKKKLFFDPQPGQITILTK